MWLYNIFIVLLGISITLAKPFQETTSKATCGYQSCHPADPTKLNVHLIPHSHDDVGWLKTVDQYYYGSKNNIQSAGVQYIIESVIYALQENPERRFIQVETAFLWKWWQKQSDTTRNLFKSLLDNGQLEIIGGAWSMNDEASSHYHSTIDQFSWGLRTLGELLGECGHPKIGWQIDPFGHSREQASIFAQLGYEGFLFARLDYRDKAQRYNTSTNEMLWRGSVNLGNVSDIFTVAIYGFYGAPPGFCFDVRCTDTPIVYDQESPDYNWEERVNAFAAYVEEAARTFKTNNLLLTMGGDFQFQAAFINYFNLDKLIEGFKLFRPDINVIYSTPSCYIKAVNDAAKLNGITFPQKTDDFFPYASDDHAYWTGYFTSRPSAKRLERQGNNLLQIVKHLTTVEKARGTDYSNDLIKLREAMGIMQHHDAITGTEKQHVAHDYTRLMKRGIDAAESNVDQMIWNNLLKVNSTNIPVVPLASCLMANVSHCPESNLNRFVVAVYNPLSRVVSHPVRLPVNSQTFEINGPFGVVPYQISPSIDNFNYVDAIQPSASDLVFIAHNIQPLGINYYYVEVSPADAKEVSNAIPVVNSNLRLGTATVGFEIDGATGLLSSITLNNITTNVKQEFLYYNGANGSNSDSSQRASGAYIFRPASTTPVAVSLSQNVTYTTRTGTLYDEVHQTFNSWIKQVIRVYKTENYIEFDWIIGPIDYIDNLAVEVISRFTTELQTNETFYTDSNGREMIKRQRNHRETYQYTNEEPVSGNYYPVTSKIVIKDAINNLEFAVLNDRAQGGSSLQDGAIELMIHRRLMNDDAFGVNEVLNEVEFGQGMVVRGQQYVTLGRIDANPDGKTSAAQQRDLAQRKLLSSWEFVGNATAAEHTLQNLQTALIFRYSSLTAALPDNVQILTLEPWQNNTILLRLEHVLEFNEDPTLSLPVVVDLTNAFTHLSITNITEMTLGANKLFGSNQRLQWNVTTTTSDEYIELPIVNDDRLDPADLLITLNPMEIRTFVIIADYKTTIVGFQDYKEDL